MKIRDWHLRRRREEQVGYLPGHVHVGLKFWQLRRPDHAITPNEKWRTNFEVAMLARVQVSMKLINARSSFAPAP